MIVGGKSDGRSAICDCWIHDLTTMKWKKVVILCVSIRYCMFVLVFSYHSLADTVTERVFHSLSAIQLSPHNVLLVVFGGKRSLSGAKLSDTALIEMSEYVYCYSDRHCTVVLVYCKHITAPLPMQSREEMVSGWWGG